jgi:hypothetical protein
LACLEPNGGCTAEQVLAASAARWFERAPTAPTYCLERHGSSADVDWQSDGAQVEVDADGLLQRCTNPVALVDRLPGSASGW